MKKTLIPAILTAMLFASCTYTVYNCPPKPYLKYQGLWLQETGETITFYEGKKQIAVWTIGRDGSSKRDGIAINGVVRKFYPDGSLMAEMVYKDNKLNYGYTEYYETGITKKEGYYVNGEASGTFVEYDINGKVTARQNFKAKKGAK